MNREDIISMAHKSHLDVYGLGKEYSMFADALERFAALIAAAEREACAKVCEDSVEYAGDTLAQAIRARGQA